jgi:tellurite resistance protein
MEMRGVCYSLDATAAEMMAAYWEAHEDELVNAVITAAALVARADGRADAVEYDRLEDFLTRNGILSAVTPAAIRELFERRVREQDDPKTAMIALRQLGYHAERPLARVIIDAGEEITAADCRIDPRERRILQLLRIILCAPAGRSLSDPTALACKAKEAISPYEAMSGDSASRHHERRIDRLIDRLPRRLGKIIGWLRQPSVRWIRIPAGLLLIIGSFLSLLPFFGLWMLPLGLLLLAEDIPPLRRTRDRLLAWIERHRPEWFHGGRPDDCLRYRRTLLQKPSLFKTQSIKAQHLRSQLLFLPVRRGRQ